MENKYSHIIWDWNGTLFDDVGWCIEVINQMLLQRGLKAIKGIADYHNAFCFPVIQYYKNVGFDLINEDFEDLASEYISLYHSNKTGKCRLYSGVEDVLKAFHDRNISQAILSASEINNLLSQISEFNISSYFNEILGISDIFAKSKIEIGLDYISRTKASRTILIGDTVHDFDVANALKADCVLIKNGHQSRETLLSCGVPLLDDISGVLNYIG